MTPRRRLLLMFLCCVLGTPVVAAERGRPVLRVFAAASLTNVLDELSAAWEKKGGMPVTTSYAASSLLARQIEVGGRADVFIAADQEWMDYLQSRNLVDKPTRRNVVGNRMVLIAPSDSTLQLRIAPGFDLSGALGKRRLATGDPDTVPVGRYARSALVSLGVWDAVQDRLVRADNVRSAMMFVSRGEVPLGIVYTTDALVDSHVRIVDTFPENSHPPITYPGAILKGASGEAIAFLDYLTSPAARDTWRRFGFLELKK